MKYVWVMYVTVWSMNNRAKKKSAELTDYYPGQKKMENLSPHIPPNERWENGTFCRSRGFTLDFVGGMRCLFQAVPFYSVQDCNRYILNKINGQFRNPSTLPRGGGGGVVAVPVSKILDLKLLPLYL